jgi:hypothetical protein
MLQNATTQQHKIIQIFKVIKYNKEYETKN